jgi:hypothetical protein
MTTRKRSARKPTVCQACGLSSFNGRVCRGCSRYWGPPVENVLAAVALRRRLDTCHSLDQVFDVLADLADHIVPDWPGANLPGLLYQARSAPAIAGADPALGHLNGH